jgi:hypothetical protein
MKLLFYVLALVLILSVLLCACTPEGPTVILNPTQTVTIGPAGLPGGSPAPSPTPAARFTTVRVGVFAQTCSSGGGVPSNAENTIRVGCLALFTVTPKDASGQDLQLPDAAWMQMHVSWAITGASCSDLNATEPNGNPFNREIRGQTPGTCVVCATVDGIQGCARQLSGEQVVRVIL